MKILRFILAALLFANTGIFPTSSAADVYIVAGQSNGWRMSHIAEGPKTPEADNLPKIYYFPMVCTSRPSKSKLQIITSLHPSIYGSELARMLREEAGREIVIVQYCVCGSSLHLPGDWFPGDNPAGGQVNDTGLYASFLNYVADARRQVEARDLTWELKGLFWHQGEGDAVAGRSAEYEKNLRHLFTRLRTDFGEDLPIVTGHIREINEEAVTVNRAIDAVAADSGRVTVVRTDDLPAESPTNWHFTVPGCHALGKRFSEAMNILQQTSNDIPPDVEPKVKLY